MSLKPWLVQLDGQEDGAGEESWRRSWWVQFCHCCIWATIWHAHSNVDLYSGIIWVWSLGRGMCWVWKSFIYTEAKCIHETGQNVSGKHCSFEQRVRVRSASRSMRTTFKGQIESNKGGQKGMAREVRGKSGKWECHKGWGKKQLHKTLPRWSWAMD